MFKEIIQQIIDNKINEIIIYSLDKYNTDKINDDMNNNKKLYIKSNFIFKSSKKINLFFNALKVNTSVTSLQLKNISSTYKVKLSFFILELSNIINDKNNISTLILKKCNLTDKELNPLFNALQFNKYVKLLDLSDNNITTFLYKEYKNLLISYNVLQENFNDINKIYNIDISNINQTMELLDKQILQLKEQLINNPFYKMLLNNKSINVLNLSNNYKCLEGLFIHLDEFKIFNNILQQNNSIHNLDISFCNISIDKILSFIKTNKYIENLIVSIHGNDQENQINQIKAVMKNNKNLKEISIYTKLSAQLYNCTLLTIKNE